MNRMNRATVTGTFLCNFEVHEGVNPIEAAKIFLDDVKDLAAKKKLVFVVNATTVSDRSGHMQTDLKQAAVRLKSPTQKK